MPMELKIGDKVLGEFITPEGKKFAYKGIVERFSPEDCRDNALLKIISGNLGIFAKGAWFVKQRPDGSWGANYDKGSLVVIESTPTIEVSMELNLWDRVRGEYDGDIYTGTVWNITRTDGNEVATIQRDDGKSGCGNICSGNKSGWLVRRRPDGSWGGSENLGTLIKINGTTTQSKGGSMPTLRDQFALSLVKEPQKSFRKAGITDNNDMLTDEGMRIFMSWLLHNKHADEFLKTVTDITEPPKA